MKNNSLTEGSHSYKLVSCSQSVQPRLTKNRQLPRGAPASRRLDELFRRGAFLIFPEKRFNIVHHAIHPFDGEFERFVRGQIDPGIFQ